jgi:DNA-directed RNA polymerase specialized sigma24 family protein
MKDNDRTATPPAFLSTIASQTEQDRVLLPEEFLPVWYWLEPKVRMFVYCAAERVSLHAAERAASGQRSEHLRHLAGVCAVREALIAPSRSEDFCQDVAEAFWKALSAGRLRASVPFLWAWLRTTTNRIVASRGGREGMLLFAAGPQPANDNSDEGREPVAPPTTERESPEWLVTAREVLKRVALVLSPREQTFIDLWLGGLDHGSIAEKMGLTPGASRLLLHRTEGKLRRAFQENDGSAERGSIERKNGPKAA